MDWPLKIQGRFVTEAEVNEVRMLLHNHPLWNRSRLSRELCWRWNWQRPDGQIKDMACRELLRKLESRTLLKLPQRQRFAPRQLPEIKPVEDFSQYEQNVYEKYQEIAEREIIAKLNELLSNISFLIILKGWGAQCACRFIEYDILVLSYLGL